MQTGLWCVGRLWRQRDPDGVCSRVNLHGLERPGIESQPQAARRDIDAHAKRVERLHPDPISFHFDVAAECEPTELRMIDDVSRIIEDVAEKVWIVIPRVTVPLDRLSEFLRHYTRSCRKLLVEVSVAANPNPNPGVVWKSLRYGAVAPRHTNGPEARVRTESLKLE